MLNRVAPVNKPADNKVVLLRREALGNNCFHIREFFKGLLIAKAEDVPPDANWVIRWGTTSNLPNHGRGMKVINKAGAIHEVADKRGFRAKLAKIGLAPRTWLTYDDCMNDEGALPNGAIVRPDKHERSKDMYHVKTEVELADAIKKIGGPYYISEYIPKDREVRVVIAQGRVLVVSDKIPKKKGAVTWGMDNFNYVRWSEWPLPAVEAAVAAFNASKLDFGAVDVIIHKNAAYVLEINTAPEVWNYYGECFAKAFKHMIKTDRKRINVLDRNTWKGFIHPVMWDK